MFFNKNDNLMNKKAKCYQLTYNLEEETNTQEGTNNKTYSKNWLNTQINKAKPLMIC